MNLSVAGVVVDGNGAPVPQAKIVLIVAGNRLTTTTDANGEFHFSQIALTENNTAPDRSAIELTVTSPGFAPNKRTIKLASGSLDKLRIVLLPAAVSANVTVLATRTETLLSDTAASVVILNSEGLQTSAALTLDDQLRQVPGFSLFRRTGSRTANPTTQGVSLRGVGPSGASRALVLADNIPLNDPFGGWVYWDRIPNESINQVEVLRGGASHLYGSSALGGAVSISTKASETNALALTASFGNESTPFSSLWLTGKKGDWRASLASEIFATSGYVPVAARERGPVDTPAASRHATNTLRLERWFGKNQHVFGSASFFGESRKNGTPLQTNRTHVREFTFGGEIVSVRDGTFAARGYGGTQVYDQNFSAVSVDRQSESLTRLQRVPVQFVGFSSQWYRNVGKHQTFVAGYESQQVRGASDEIVFVNGRPTSLVGAGGRQQNYGGYFEDLIRFGTHLFVTGSARFDFWRNNNATSSSRPVTANNATNVISFPDRTESAFSPQVSAVFKINAHVSLLGSAMRAFRAPTLNELYRSFRVGNVLTLANENLHAERLSGAEAGVRFSSANDAFVARSTFFWNEISKPVANVTLTTTPTLITRQRQNLGKTRSRGVELEADANVSQRWQVSAGYLFADAKVVEFPANTALEGLSIPQVARHQFTLQTRYSDPSLFTVALQARASSSQFDDDQNLFRLSGYFTLDAFVSHRFSREFEGFVAVENLFDQRYEVGKTPVTTLGPPILIRAGVRVRVPLSREP